MRLHHFYLNEEFKNLTAHFVEPFIQKKHKEILKLDTHKVKALSEINIQKN